MEFVVGLVIPLALIGLALPIIALVVASTTRTSLGGELRDLRNRLTLLERRLRAIEDHAEPGAVAVEAAPAAAPSAPAAATPTVTAEPLPDPPPLPAAAAPVPGAKTAVGLEERLGGRISVWVGAVALVLAGGFLVKYSLDRNLLSPEIRVILGLIFGLALLGGGEWMRPRASQPASGLAAAGIGVLYGVFLAATRVYDLLTPTGGFFALALTTVAAVGLALRHGQLVGFIGLIGGFATPVLVGAKESSAILLFLYLAALEVGIAAIARRRGWIALLATAAVAGFGWAAVWLAFDDKPDERIWLSIYVLASAAIYVTAVGLPGWRRAFIASVADWPVAVAAVVAAAALQAFVLRRSGWVAGDWVLLMAPCVAAALLDRFDRRYRHFGWFGVAFPLAVLAFWPVGAGEDETWRHMATGIAIGGMLAGGAIGLSHSSSQAGRWAAMSVLASAAAFIILWYRVATPGLVLWGVASLALAAVYLLLLLAQQRATPQWRTEDNFLHAITAYAVGVTGFVSLAVPFEFTRVWIAVAWASEIAALAWLDNRLAPPDVRLPAFLSELRRPYPPLRVVAALLLIATIAKLAHVTFLQFTQFTGEGVLWLWLLYGHGLPIVALTVASLWLLERRDDVFQRMIEWSAIWLAIYTAWFMVALLFRGPMVFIIPPELIEAGTECVVALALANGLAALGLRFPRRSIVLSAQAAAVAGIVVTYAWPFLWLNPALRHADVGTWPILNGLLWVYAAPAAVAGLFAWRALRFGSVWLLIATGGGALGLSFVWLVFEVRHWFHPESMERGGAGSGEQVAYSVACLLFGAAVMAGGVLRDMRVLRYVALGIITLAVFKVFLFDASALEGLYRVASFLGLGLCLIGLGFAYQRAVGHPAPR
ncbi:MAG TPA: DUF2339 domain-containing protein [Candidatus Cybelea sp.]|nr:DUF2339 domain-containing protein [Candidatus Cybelea sp.]